MLNNNKLKINMTDSHSLNPRRHSSEDMVEFSEVESLEFKDRCIQILKEKTKKVVNGNISSYHKSVYYSELDPRDQKFIKS